MFQTPKPPTLNSKHGVAALSNIEIWGISESVNDKQLKDKVIEIGKAVNINLGISRHAIAFLDVRATKDLNVP